jgi:pilus assembly protein Flp/PilA
MPWLPFQKEVGFMFWFLSRARCFLKEEEGPTAVEYAMMLALIVIVCIAAIATLGTNANKVFANSTLNNTLNVGS